MAGEEELSDAAKAVQKLLGGPMTEEVNSYSDSHVDPDTAAVFTELFKDAKKRRDASTEGAEKIYQDYLSIGKPFGLFLRAFESEAYRYNIRGGKSSEEENDLFRLRGPQSVEQHLYSTLHKRVPFIAVQSPVDLLAGGLIPRFSGGGDKDWESEVERLAREAALIVFHCYALGHGVRVELNLLRRCRREDSTVIVLEDGDSSKEFSLELISRIANVTSHEVPRKNHQALIGFSRVVYEREIDWDRPEKDPLLGDLLQAVLRQEARSHITLPDLTWLPPTDQMFVLNDRARALRLKGHFEGAAAAAMEALAIAKRLGDPGNIAASHVGLGIVTFEMGQFDVALEAFYDGGTMFHSLGDKDGEATAAAWAGRVLKKAGDAESAVRIFLTALQLSKELHAFDDMGDTLREMAPLLDQIGPELMQHPGVQLAAKLIELDPNQSGPPDSTRGNRRAPRWRRRRNS